MGGPTRDREQFPAVKDRIGEDPARFLDYPEDPEGLRLAYARIRGIDRQEVVVEWLRVERELERGPRETVIGWIQERNRELVEHGDRDDHLEQRREIRDDVSAEIIWADTPDGERPVSASAKLSSRTFATDGGASR
jgi:hypothetical protein